jgi:uncharacterized repeat protein (TIGR01451 family)
MRPIGQGWTHRRVLGMAASIVAAWVLALPGGASGFDAKLKRYPYLTDLVGTSVMVNWGTDISLQNGVVKYGQVGAESCTAHTAAPATKTFVFVNGVSEYQWKSQLSGLAADTQYCYRVYFGTSQVDLLGTDPSPSFRTQVPTSSTEPFSFAVFGDWGKVGATAQNQDETNVISQVAASGARFAVTTGNNAYDQGSQRAYGDLYQTGNNTSAVFGPNFWKLAGSSVPLFPTLGNHDTANSVLPLTWPQDTAVATSGGRNTTDTYCCVNGTLSTDYPSTWYAFDAGPARFYVLDAAWDDANRGTADTYKNDFDTHWAPGTPQWEWLKADLQTHPRTVRFAFFHYPMYTDNSSPGSDTYLRGPTALEGLLKANDVTVAFSGNSHQYQRNSATADGVPSYVTGGGGATLEPIGTAGCHPPDEYGIGWRSSPKSVGSACPSAPVPTSKTRVHHFLLVNVQGSSVTVTPIDELGRSFDQFAYGPATPPADLTLTKAATPEPVFPGQPLTYDLSVQNTGSNAADGVRVVDTLPAGVTFDSATPSQGSCLQASGVVSCALGALANGSGATIQIEVRPATSGTIANQASVTSNNADPDQSDNNATAETTVVPPAGYPRVRGATPLRVSLVPAFAACPSATANSTHGPALSFASCAPPAAAADNLTVGTPDANGAPSNFTGSVLFNALADDVRIRSDISDVRCGTVTATCGTPNVSSGDDYTGELQIAYDLRITDLANPSASPATVTDTSFPAKMTCGETASDAVGASCALDTTANAIVPGTIGAGNRTNWELGQVHIDDGGPDGIVDTTPNGLFAVQGVFVP